MKHSASFHATYSGAFIASAFCLLAWAQPASAQTVFGTGFDTAPYQSGFTLSGQENWDSNDDYTGSTYGTGAAARDIGQSDAVVATGNAALGNQGQLGGFANATGGAVPGHQTSYVYRPFALGAAATMAFNVDYIVSASTNGTGTTALSQRKDTFGFTFQSAAANLFSINFAPLVNTTDSRFLTQDNFTITTGAGTTTTASSFTLGNRYHLAVNVNIAAGTFSATVQPEDSTGNLSGAVITLTPVGGTAFAGTISRVAATWALVDPTTGTASTAAGTNATPFTNGGSNTLAFDNYVVSVPEPSTWALLGAGTLAFVLIARRRSVRVA